jgi:hypothetical protein
MEEAYTVRAPIRYGRRSESRSNTFTMAFSRECEAGQAKVVRCRNDVSTENDLFAEAEHLWAVERKRELNGLISANWGCVALLHHLDRHVPQELFDAWAVRVARDRHYGNIPQAAGEGPLVSERGLLQIPWPTLIDGNDVVPLDLLIATATHPSLEGEPKSYPTPEMIANAWRMDRNNNVSYFWNNIRVGIRTFGDDAIRERLIG